MYHRTVIEKRMNRMADVIRTNTDPAFEFIDHPIAKCAEISEQLQSLWDADKASLTRPLTIEEDAWVRHEQARCKVDFDYWARRYAFLKTKDMKLIRYVPTAVQDLFLTRIQTAELESISGQTGDGIIFACMKARQLGISTISEIIIAHRTFFYGNTTALIAADTPERSMNLFEMLVRIYDNLPWFLQPRSLDPKRDYRVKGKQILFADQDSIIRVGSSSNMQGGDAGGDKGSLGTGMTLPLCHLSELALWENPKQIDDALMPSIPESSHTFAVFESTAKGRHNWWHDAWMTAKQGIGRRRAIFIPWFTDPNTYKKPAPLDWVVPDICTAHAKKVAETSAYWVGHSVNLTKDQLYWWFKMQEDYSHRGLLHVFLAEYAADDLEAFQNSSTSVFSQQMLHDMRQKANATPVIVDIYPKTLNNE